LVFAVSCGLVVPASTLVVKSQKNASKNLEEVDFLKIENSQKSLTKIQKNAYISKISNVNIPFLD